MNIEEARYLLDALESVGTVDVSISVGGVQLPVPETEPVPIPIPEEAVFYVVNDDKSLANRIKGKNNAGYPIMVIYEDEGGDRLRFDRGDDIRVDPEEIRADGGSVWYRIIEFTTQDGDLYLEKSKGYLYRS